MIKNIAVLLTLSAVSCFAAPFLNPVSPANVPIGAVFTVAILASNVTDLYAYQVDVLFDPSLFEAESVIEGPFLKTGGATFFSGGFIDNTNGFVVNNADTLIGPGHGVNGSGVLFNVEFRALKAGSSEFVLDSALGLNSSLNDVGFTLERPAPITVTGLTAVLAPEPGTFLSTSGFGLALILAGGLRAKQKAQRASPTGQHIEKGIASAMLFQYLD